MLGWRVTFTANIYGPLDTRMVILPYNFVDESFRITELCTRLYSTQIAFCSEKRQIRIFEPPFGGLRRNVRTASKTDWKARGWFSICDNWTFLLAITVKINVKGNAEHLYSSLHGTNHFKALRHGSHSSTCKEHHACLYLVSVHQMVPPLNVVANI